MDRRCQGRCRKTIQLTPIALSAVGENHDLGVQASLARKRCCCSPVAGAPSNTFRAWGGVGAVRLGALAEQFDSQLIKYDAPPVSCGSRDLRRNCTFAASRSRARGWEAAGAGGEGGEEGWASSRT